MPCKHELERESRIILQIMAKRIHFIKKLPLDQVALYQKTATGSVFIKKLPVKLIQFMHKNKWLNKTDNLYHFTDEGRDWVSKFIYFLDMNMPTELPDGSENSTEKQAMNINHQRPDGLAERSQMALLQSDSDYGPLLKLYNRQRNMAQKYLTIEHLQAGQKLFTEFTKANLQPKVTMDWDKLNSVPQPHYTGNALGAGQMGFSEAIYAARKRLYESLAYVGHEYAAILVEICLFGNGLEATERAMNWPARSGKLLLTMALDRLADYYGISLKRPRSNKYLSWAKSQINSEN